MHKQNTHQKNNNIAAENGNYFRVLCENTYREKECYTVWAAAERLFAEAVWEVG